MTDSILVSFWGGRWHKAVVTFEIKVGVLRDSDDNWMDMPPPGESGPVERYDLKRLMSWPGCQTKRAKTWFSGNLRPDQPSPMHQPVTSGGAT